MSARPPMTRLPPHHLAYELSSNADPGPGDRAAGNGFVPGAGQYAPGSLGGPQGTLAASFQQRVRSRPVSIVQSATSVLSIGALSKATGVPTETLRTWERRYGFPTPTERTESGHRRYPLETVNRIRLIVRALDRGHKAALVVGSDLETLRELLSVHEPAPIREPSPTPGNRDACVARWIEHILAYDGDAFIRDLRQRWNETGAIPVMVDYLGPFLDEVGRRWSMGELQVAHEHFVSEHIHEFLSTQWRPLSERTEDAPMVCAAPPGEQHTLGLHMAAMAIAVANVGVVFLGANTPVMDIVTTAEQRGACGIALSASSALPKTQLSESVSQLRSLVPSSIPIVVGGAGFDPPLEGTVHQPGLAELSQWASQQRRSTSRSMR